MEMKLTRIQVLRKALEMAEHNLLCYSKTYGMKSPKEGCEDEWKKAKEESDILRQMIDEFLHYCNDDEHGESVYYRKYICTIASWSVSKNLDAEDIIDLLEIEIDTPTREHAETRLLRVDKPCSDYILAEYDTRRHRCYDAGVSASIILYVDSINYICKVEWVSSEVDIQKGLDQYDS